MKKENTDIWGFISIVAFIVMMWTVGANEGGYLSNAAFFVCFAVQTSIWMYTLYKAKAFIWQAEENKK